MQEDLSIIKQQNKIETSIKELISINDGMRVDDLSANAKALSGFLALIVDIEYRLKYDSPLYKRASRRAKGAREVRT